VRENHEQDVSARLFSVLGAPDPPPGPAPLASAFPDAGTAAEDGRLTWSDVVPSWPDDVDLGAVAERPATGGAALEDYAWTVETVPPPTPPPTPPPAPRRVDGAGAFSTDASQLRLFDPGRRGVRALAAVAVCVVLIAAFLAWRARPRVDPVAAPPVEVAAADGMAAAATPDGSTGPAAEVVVAVAGKVGRPGLVRLPAGARVADALTAAGGARPGVDVAMLNPARKVVDGELILVGVAASPGATPPPPVGAAPAGGPVNLNTATVAELDTLPGVGPVLAQRIMDARTAQGGFRAVSDLRKVDGIGSSRYEQLKDLVTV
jgi:competence protein ComEA